MKNEIAHRIYIGDINFMIRKSISEEEKKLRKRSEFYKNLLEKRWYACRNFSGVNSVDFAGMVDYIPDNSEKDIRKSCDIILYLYSKNKILLNPYKFTIKLLCNFINKHNIESIQLSGDDIERFESNNINIIDDIKNEIKNNIKIFITDKVRTNKYSVVDIK